MASSSSSSSSTKRVPFHKFHPHRSVGRCIDTLDINTYGPQSHPSYSGEKAKEFKFELDDFQKCSISCLERSENVIVCTCGPAGKATVVEYLIAMAERDKLRVVFTSSSPDRCTMKYLDLKDRCGDVQLVHVTDDNQELPEEDCYCLFMPCEILRRKMYSHLHDFGFIDWIVFDEVDDMERPYQEIMFRLHKSVNSVFLSSRMSEGSALDFVDWASEITAKGCHLVHDFNRGTPLRVFVFPQGGSKLELLVDESGTFWEPDFLTSVNNASSSKTSDFENIANLIKENQFLPFVFFCVTRDDCGEYASLIPSTVQFIDETEKGRLICIYNNAISTMCEEDREIAETAKMLELLKRGIAIYHLGLIPLMKELVELLFQEGLVKALFTTENFAAGFHMTTKTVVFRSVREWDGDIPRYVGSCEYRKMSERAGRRGKDEFGVCIILMNQQMKIENIKTMVLVLPKPLIGNSMMSYNTMLAVERSNLPARTYFQRFQILKPFIDNFYKFNALRKKPVEKRSDEEKLEFEQVDRALCDTSDLDKHDEDTAKQKVVLTRLGYIEMDGDAVQVGVELKRQAACLIDIGDVLFVTQSLFNGVFSGLDVYQTAAVASCFICREEVVDVSTEKSDFEESLQKLQSIAREIATVQAEAGFEVDEDEYVAEVVRISLMRAIYQWSKGLSLKEAMKFTDVEISPGCFVRFTRMLVQLLEQLEAAARLIGVVDQAKLFGARSGHIMAWHGGRKFFA